MRDYLKSLEYGHRAARVADTIIKWFLIVTLGLGALYLLSA